MNKLCTCGSPVNGPRGMEMHKRSMWHKVAREVRNYRKMGFSYTQIAAKIEYCITPQCIAYHFKREQSFLLTNNKGKHKVKL